MTHNNGDKSFDLAVLIDSSNQFNKILCGPILYELKPRYLHFVSHKKYVTGDINVVNKAANFVQEIDPEKYIKGYIRNSCDITNSFKKVTKIRLFKFKDDGSMWTNYVNAQKHTHADIFIVVNDKNHPVYVLHDTDIDFTNQSIKYKSCKEYQKNDVQILNLYATKFKAFLLNKKWKIPLTLDRDTVFKNGICYNFSTEDSKNSFFGQSYDVALVTNDKNQIQVLLSGIRYMYNDNTIIFKSVIPYKNGYYDILKQYGEQIKALKINEYKLCNTDISYAFEKDFIKHKCMLFNIKDIDKWLEYISVITTSMYDIGVITNNDEYQTYFLNKTSINWMDKMISFGALEKFTPKHHGIITKFAKLIKKTDLNGFMITDFESDAINEIYFYQWDLHKESDDDSYSESESEENKQSMSDNGLYESEQAQVAKKKKIKKKKAKKKRKSRKTQSEMPNANAPQYNKYKIKDKKDRKSKKYKRDGKTRSEIVSKRRISKRQSRKKKEKIRRKDSVIRPSVMKKLKKHNTNNSSELNIVKSTDSEINTNGPTKSKQIEHAHITKNSEKITNMNNSIVYEQKEKEKEQTLKQTPKISNKNSEKMIGIVNAQKEKEKEPKILVNSNKQTVKQAAQISKDQIWDLYVETYGMKPRNTNQLQNFAKITDNITHLSYKEARTIFQERAK